MFVIIPEWDNSYYTWTITQLSASRAFVGQCGIMGRKPIFPTPKVFDCFLWYVILFEYPFLETAGPSLSWLAALKWIGGSWQVLFGVFFPPSFGFLQDYCVGVRGFFPFHCLIALHWLKSFLLACVTYICSLTFVAALKSTARRKGHK